MLGLHPAKSTLYPLTTRGGAYSALIIWSWAECPASAPEVASWGRKGDGEIHLEMSHVGINDLGGTLAPGNAGNAGNAMATSKCLAGSLAKGRGSCPESRSFPSSGQGVIQELPAESLGWRRRGRSRNKLSPSGPARGWQGDHCLLFKYCWSR